MLLRLQAKKSCASLLRPWCWRGVSSSSSRPHVHQWSSAVVRSTFIDYFTKQKGHVFHASSPVVPHDDPSLLFANAGMNQFKPLFLGTADPTSPLSRLSRAVNSQKCIRAGGKHNDLADVGKDTYHHTFFEMLGTWSFNGAYSQGEAIDWAFDLLTRPDLFALDPDRLYVSYFGGDATCGLEEDVATRDAWLRHLPPDRVLPFQGVSGENFWEMGDTGPCGPCTEIHYDRIGSRNAAHLVNADDPNVLEIWNLVFMQYNRPEAEAKLLPLPALHIDTGMGLERITSILQQKTSNYDTDIFMNILDAVHAEFRLPFATGARAGKEGDQHQLPPYGFSEYLSATAFAAEYGARSPAWQLQEKQLQLRDLSYRVIADHLRTASVAIADGTQLSSGGRGYVIRRVLRRALRYAQLLSKEAHALAEQPPEFDAGETGRASLRGTDPRLSGIIPTVVQQLGDFYPELKAAEKRIIDIIREEEKSFAALLSRGVRFLEDKMQEMAQGHEDAIELTLSGEDVFYLYDTLGFPVDLTELIVEEHNEQSSAKVRFRLDLEGYEVAMSKQKARAGKAHTRHKQALLGLNGDTSLSPSISSLHSLRQEQLPVTDDSFKFFAPTIGGAAARNQESSVQATVLKVFTNERAFHDTLSAEASSGVFGLLLDRTVFYAEGGGQVADTGFIRFTQTNSSSSAPVTLTARVIDVQVYGQHILHTCVLLPTDSEESPHKGATYDLLRQGTVCELQVDRARRDRIAPNHTMTHVLNAVLREVLQSDSIDQKGSLVSEEKMRFDFSYDKALSLSVVEKIEARVNAIITADLGVHTATVPLEAAQRLKGVRAVFGEHYPDPVRVVGIGLPCSLDQLVIQAAGSEAGGEAGHSIEFCGGTHLMSTGQAQAWVVLEETAVAKGVRRLVAVTGDTAVVAQDRAREFKERSDDLRRQIADFVVSAHKQLIAQAATGWNENSSNEMGKRLEELQVQLNELKEAVEKAEISITVSHPLRQQFQQSQKELIGCRKKYVAAVVEESIVSLLAQTKLADSSSDAHPSFSCAVLEMRLPPLVSCDAGVMKTVTQRLREDTPSDFCFLVLCPDQVKGKLWCFASVSTPSSVKMSAARWVKAVTEALGGKGGGRDNAAQGSIDMDRDRSGDICIDSNREENWDADYRIAVKQAKWYMQESRQNRQV